MDTTTRREVTHMSTEAKTAGKRLGWGDCPGVERDPNRLAGAWTFDNAQLPLHAVFENQAGGATIQGGNPPIQRHRGTNQDRSGPHGPDAGRGPAHRRGSLKILLDHKAPSASQCVSNNS